MRYTTHYLRHLRSVIGQNIQQHRMRQHLTLEKLAHQTGISVRLLDQFELGKNELKLDGIAKIACALNVEPTSLLIESSE